MILQIRKKVEKMLRRNNVVDEVVNVILRQEKGTGHPSLRVRCWVTTRIYVNCSAG